MHDQETGVNAEAAAQPSQTSGEPSQDQYVPVSALQAERRERQQLQETVRAMQEHLSLMQASHSQKPKEDDLSDNDVLTVGEAKKFIQNMAKEQKMAVEELKMTQANPDYSEVVSKYLPDVIKQDPDLKDAIMASPNPYKMAYYLAKKSDQYLMDQREKSRSPEAQKAAQNLSKPGNLSSVGTGISGSASQSYKTMSDKDFQSLVNRNMGYF